MHCRVVRQFGRRCRLALGLNGAIFLNFFAVECFQWLRESFSQGLHSVVILSWEANDANMILSM